MTTDGAIMRVGFTGTRSVPPERVTEVHEFLGGAVPTEAVEFTTGACVGFDAIAARWLLAEHPGALHRLAVPANRKQVDTDLFHDFLTASISGWTVIECCPAGTDYRYRNQRIVLLSDRLIAVADYPEKHGKSTRSGTWQTVRLARAAGVLVTELILNP